MPLPFNGISIALNRTMGRAKSVSAFIRYNLFIVVWLTGSLGFAQNQYIDPFLTCTFVKRQISNSGRVTDRKAYFSTFAQWPGTGVLMLSRLDGETAFIIHNFGAKIPFPNAEELATATLLNRLVNPAEKTTDPDAVLIAGVETYGQGGQFWLSESNFKTQLRKEEPQTEHLFEFINQRNDGILYQDQSTNNLAQHDIDLKIRNSEITLISCQALF